MKRPFKKLSPSKQRELDRYVEIVEESFAKATATKRAERLKDGRILKIILYGSYARGDWVHDPVGRYFSDFDLLVIVDHEDLTDAEYWTEANDRLMEQVSLGASRTPTELIVHSLDDVNWKLEHGRPFFIDIVREGIVLRDTPGVALSDPSPLSPTTALDETIAYVEEWKTSYRGFSRTAQFQISDENPKLAAFSLHQATEALYQGLLLTLTLYTPKSHNLVHLRNMTEGLESRLRDVWPHETKFQKRCFELLRAAYVKARYSRHYRITEEELAWLTERIEVLRGIVADASEAQLARLRAAAGDA